MSSRSWKKIILSSIFLILSLFYTVMFFQHAAFGNEMMFNIAHIKSLGNVFTSPINFDYWNHSGSQINFYSPWLTILSGLIFLNGNVAYGYSAFLTLITFLTLASAYVYMMKFSKDTLESLLFSVIYSFSFNRFFLVFQEQRLENYLVLIFLPMVYYGAYQVFRGQKGHWLNLACGMSLIVWTAPYVALGVFITLVPMVVLMLFSKISHNWPYWGHLMLDLLQAVGLTLLMTIGFWGPLIENQAQNKFVQEPMTNFNYQKWFNNLGLNNTQEYLLLAIGILLGLLLILIFLKSSFSYKLLMLETIPLVTLLLVKVELTGLDISRLIFALQSILDFFAIIILTRIVIMLFQESPVILRLLILCATIIGLCFMTYTQASSMNSKQTLSASSKVDYTKVITNYHDLAGNNHNRFSVNERNAQVSFYTKNSNYWIQYYDPKASTMDLPLPIYAGYQVELNNEAVKTTVSERKTLQLQTNPGKNMIEIQAHYTILAIISLVANLLGIILFGYLAVRQSRWPSKKNS